MTDSIAASLAEAHRTLATKFHGSACSNCGSTIRYYRGGGCVACAKARTLAWQKENREVGRERARRHYQQSKKQRTARVRDCLVVAKAAVKDTPINDALRLSCVRDLLLALGAVEMPADGAGVLDPWGGL